MLRFKKLIIKNFMPFGDRVVIHLHKQGVVRIEGRNLDEPEKDSNGSGKSAIIEALIWVLFGRTIRGLKHDKVVNRFAKKNCSVEVRFSSGSEDYTIRRYRRHKKYSNHLYVWNGKRLISFRHDDDTQQRIIQILGSDYNSFSNSVVFGGVRPFASLPDSEQKKILEGFLHFEQFDEALGRTKEFITRREDERQEILLSIERRSGRRAKYQEKLQTLKKSESFFIQDLRQRLQHAKEKARHLQSDPRRGEELSHSVDKAEAKLEKRQSRYSDLKAEVTSCVKQLGKVRESIKNRAQLVGKSCPTCGTKISPSTIAAYLDHVTSEKSKLKAKLKVASEKLDQVEKEVKHGSAVLKDLQTKLQKLSATALKSKEAEEELRRCKKNLAEALSSASPLEVEIAEASIKFSRALSKQLRAEQKLVSLEQNLEDLRFWEKGFGNSGIKSLIIKEALPALNHKLGEYSREIFGKNVELKFLPTKTNKSGGERELFNVYYKAKKGADAYTGESSGRKRRVDICILLCFSWISRISDLLLVDELLDGLDESGSRCVLRILEAQRGTTLVISHRKDVKSEAGKVWIVTKKNGYSTVEAA